MLGTTTLRLLARPTMTDVSWTVSHSATCIISLELKPVSGQQCQDGPLV